MKAAWRAALVVLAAALTGAAHDAGAQSSNLGALTGDDNGKPINIEAEQGIEWRQNDRLYIARGHAKATRGVNDVRGDTLYAYYRPVAGPAQIASATPHPLAAPTKQDTGTGAGFADGSTEIYRMEADGHVIFETPTQTAYGDHAIYDVDQSLLVVTGQHLKLVTPRDVVTARDSLEWYDKQQLAVARGDAVALQEVKTVRGDVLTALVEKPEGQPSHISRIDAQGHVVVSSPDQIGRGDSGVYNLDTGIATLTGNVTLTRGDNELRGQYGVVDLNKNISHLLSAPPSAKLTGGPPPRVQGLLVPRQKQPEVPPSTTPKQP